MIDSLRKDIKPPCLSSIFWTITCARTTPQLVVYQLLYTEAYNYHSTCALLTATLLGISSIHLQIASLYVTLWYFKINLSAHANLTEQYSGSSFTLCRTPSCSIYKIHTMPPQMHTTSTKQANKQTFNQQQ